MKNHIPLLLLVILFALMVSCGGVYDLTATLPAKVFPELTSTPTPDKDPTLGDTWDRLADSMVMVYVPAGKFEMGSNEEDMDRIFQMCPGWGLKCERTWFDDEQPAHTVAVDGFWIDRTEITNAQFAVFLNEQGNQEEGGVNWLDLEDEDCRIERTSGQYRPMSEYADHPVVEVAWYGAMAYCEWVGGRLPTEAEWEYAARGPEGAIFPWGDTFDCSRSNFDDETRLDDYLVPGREGCDGHLKTSPVGSFSDGASWVGVLDMAGNVWEWVADWYDDDYYSRSPSENPIGPYSGEHRVIRGGSWFSDPYIARSAVRGRDSPDGTGSYLGFRCAKDSQPRSFAESTRMSNSL
jgi:serine/threonine-protein kinase